MPRPQSLLPSTTLIFELTFLPFGNACLTFNQNTRTRWSWIRSRPFQSRAIHFGGRNKFKKKGPKQGSESAKKGRYSEVGEF